MSIQVQTGTASKNANYLREFDPALDLQLKSMVLEGGVEPPQGLPYWILSPLTGLV